ncbi:MAG: hypothetical protein KAR42_04885 [candidate division Zixibacteria bacterium]|nr:hypothetical protein [candidate division Zixibacteria bacterium]
MTRVVLFLILLFFFSPLNANPTDAVTGYIDAVKVGDFTIAQTYWDESYIKASAKLGIEYRDVRLKYDCASPISQNLEAIQSGMCQVYSSLVLQQDSTAKVTVHLISPSDSADFTYLCCLIDGDWKITSPYYYKIKDMPVRQTKYCRIYYSDETLLNSYACMQIDRFIEATAKSLGVSFEKLNILSSVGITYLLLPDVDVMELVGYPTKGMYDVPSDAIITSRLPHNHELTHLLVNYAQENPSLFTSPFMQEGVACYFGGRWGRSSRIINYIGYVNLQFKLAGPEDILTYDGFHNKIGNADISYPISSLFVGYLVQTLDRESFLSLYDDFSGTGEGVKKLSLSNAKKLITEKTGLDWNVISSRFERRWQRYFRCGIVPFETQLSADSAAVSVNDTINYSIWDVGNTYLIEVDLSKAPKGGVLLLSNDSTAAHDLYSSFLFNEQLPERAFLHQRFGLKITPSEIGIYDYFTNELLASFVYGFELDYSPDNAASNIYRFRINKIIFGIEDLLDYKMTIVAL